jgi:TPR repeat protein
LDNCYKYRKEVKIDLAKAFHWYQKSAETRNSTEQSNLDTCYESRKEVEIDLAKVFHWYQNSNVA